MKYIIAKFAFSALFALTFAADCEFKGQSLAAGEDYTPIGECVIYTCHNGGGVGGKTCPYAPTPAGCKQTEQDLTKPFPNCCPEIKCA